MNLDDLSAEEIEAAARDEVMAEMLPLLEAMTSQFEAGCRCFFCGVYVSVAFEPFPEPCRGGRRVEVCNHTEACPYVAAKELLEGK